MPEAKVKKGGRPQKWRQALRFLPALAVLALSLGVTNWAWRQSRNHVRERNQERFKEDIDQTTLAVINRLFHYESVLRGLTGLFTASERVTPDEWQIYMDRVSVLQNYPAINHVMYAARTGIEDGAKPSNPKGAVAPDAAGEQNHARVRFLEPAREEAAWEALDLGSIAGVSEAMEYSCETDLPTLTPPLLLSQGCDEPACVALCLPVYERNAPPLYVVEDRKRATTGWVIATLDVERLLNDVIGKSTQRINLGVYDGTDLTPEHKLNRGSQTDEAQPQAEDWKLAQVRPFDFGGRTWTLRFEAAPGYFNDNERAEPRLILIAGIVLSLLLFAVVWTLTTLRARALALAGEMTKAFRASEAQAQKLALVAARTEKGVMVLDAAGRVEWANEGFSRLSEYAFAEVEGRSFEEVLELLGSDAETVSRACEHLRRGESFTVDAINISKQGRKYWVALEIQPILGESGEMRHFIALGTDITARKASEEELIRAKEAALAANKAKSEFVANMSHEIRTPLNGVVGMIDLLMVSGLDPRQQRHARIAKASADALLSLINDILDFSKIEAGRMDLDEIDFSPELLLEDLVESFSHGAIEQGLELACTVEPEAPHMVRGDAERLRQVLTNLLNNAIKFTRRGCVVARMRVLEREGEFVRMRFEVADTGIGIPKDRLDRLFKSFSQVDSSTTRRFGGTGLGLAISKRLVEMMGGRIEVESEPGKGSTFRFTVRMRVTSAAPCVPARLLDDFRHLRLLVADDNPTNREVLREQLSAWKLAGDFVADGAAALQSLHAAADEGRPYQLALLDMKMPEMNGLDVARVIKADPRIAGTAVILLTSVDDEPEAASLAAAGVSARLIKPVRQSRLFEAIVDALAWEKPAHELGHSQGLAPGAQNPPSSTRGARILLAEDHEVNQEVAREILTCEGYQCDTVCNGRLALEALRRTAYDIVLMDCQMPEMDGLEATRLIRQDEAAGRRTASGLARIPIIALTANAFRGDREACLEAGMDAHVSKPVSRTELIRTLEAFLLHQAPPAAAPEAPASVAPVPAASSELFDPAALLERCMGNGDLAGKLLGRFVEQTPSDLRPLEAALTAADGPAFAVAAHKIKGVAATLGAEPLRQTAAALEQLGRQGRVDEEAAMGLDRLRVELEQTVCAIREFRSNHNRVQE